jgi:uncharacterized protein YgiB involved in biofilm formation
MKRSRKVQLALVSSVPFALTACDGNSTRTISESRTYENVQACVNAQVPADICADSYMAALAEHKRLAPLFGSRADCEADFLKDYCAQTSEGKWMPALGGFQITSQYEEKLNPDGTSAGVRGSEHVHHTSDNFLTGLLIGQALGGGRHYYSEPIYTFRDSRGSFAKSTLAKQIAAGKTFQKSEQVRRGMTYTSSDSALRRGSSLNARSTSISSATSRGGFGSQSSARSGWGGFGG